MRAEIKGGGKLMRRRNLKVALVNTVLAAIILGLYFALSLSHRGTACERIGLSDLSRKQQEVCCDRMRRNVGCRRIG